MLNRWLRTLNTLPRFGVAAARLTAAGRRLRTTGRAALTNGRIWFWRTEHVEFVPQVAAFGPPRLMIAWLAAGIACTAGIRLVAAGPRMFANAVTFRSVAVVCCRVP